MGCKMSIRRRRLADDGSYDKLKHLQKEFDTEEPSKTVRRSDPGLPSLLQADGKGCDSKLEQVDNAFSVDTWHPAARQSDILIHEFSDAADIGAVESQPASCAESGIGLPSVQLGGTTFVVSWGNDWKFDSGIPALYVGRMVCTLTTCSCVIDMYLDGGVEVTLVHEGFATIATLMVASMVVPQVLTWLFLKAHKMSDVWVFLRIILFPSLSATFFLGFKLWGAWGSYVLRDLAMFATSISLEPWHLLSRAWKDGSQVTESRWLSIAEGLIEAPCSSTLTVLVSLLISSVRLQSTSALFLASVLTSFLSVSYASTELHFYGQKPALAKYIKTLVFVKFPQVASQILGYAFFGFFTHPIAATMEDLVKHNEMYLMLMFLLLEISLNVGIIIAVGANMSMDKILIFACTMAVGGPPGFLRSLDAARPLHAIQHFAILAVMAAVSIKTASFEHLNLVFRFYSVFFFLCIAAAVWALAIALLTYEQIPPKERIHLATRRLDQALAEEDSIMAALLIDLEGASVNMDPVHVIGNSTTLCEECFFASCTSDGSATWAGVVTYQGKLYCCPCDAKAVMVIDPITTLVTFIDTGKEQGGQKWNGIAECQGKIYCCPYNAAEVLVIDLFSGCVTFIDTRRGDGGEKWYGITECHGKLYFCPYHASEVMVIDPTTGRVTFIPTCRGQGGWKWSGTAYCQGKIYYAPRNASEVMVLDPDTETVSFIDTGKGGGGGKWSGIVECQGKLYCCPFDATEVMVIDPITASVTFIDTGMAQGGEKWSGAAECQGKLYFCPHRAAEVMVFDPRTESVTFIDTGKARGNRKWDGITEFQGKLYCCPNEAAEVLAIDSSLVKETRAELFVRLFRRAPQLQPPNSLDVK